jgi:hypothetical protein
MQRAFVFLSLLMCGLLIEAADMPVTRITLYKHGIGFFEREGIVPAGQELRLDFQTGDMNDVLKSLTVSDLSGGRINAVRYDSNETPEQRLAKFPFQIGNSQLLSAFLDSLKGARLEVSLADSKLEGVIVGARATQVGAVHEQLTMLLDSGDVTNYDLATIRSLRMLDPQLENLFKQYLQTIAQTKSRESRSVYIEASNKDARHLRASYIIPTAIWKSSYRLTLAEPRSTLEGWAIVDNTTDEDWTKVQLSVVSGRPISFISLLDTPRYGQRQVAELPEDRAAGPVVYSGTVDALADTNGAVAGGVIGGVMGGVGPASPPPLPKAAPREFTALQSAQSSIEGATGATLGELFEYQFAGPVTIRKNQSAMLPFVQDKVAARKLLIYTERDGEHPVNAAELTNSTEKTLDGGPITVYDGGAYAGEALIETLKAGDKRLIGYAVDFGTRITSQYGSGDQHVREVHVANGTLRVRCAEQQTRTYTIRNVDAKPKTLLIQEDAAPQHALISPQPSERTASTYRFTVNLPANGAQTLKVEQERTTFSEDALTSLTPDVLLTIVQNKELPDGARSQLNAILDLKRRIVAAGSSLDATKSQLADLTADQTRLRQNIDSLNRVPGQEQAVRNYASELGNNESRIAQLTEQSRTVATQKGNLEADLRTAIGKLDF